MFVILALLVWAGLTWTGYDLYRLTRARVPDSPYLQGQLVGYVLLPLIITAVAGMLAVLLRLASRWGNWIGALGFVLLVAVLPFLSSYTGGV